ncbi:MAG: apolipoprotein N-acyltransferase [Candidatus Melainabacteria bacterium]|nr:apolipoprotein N-acyltransferase [Candidatus Melainabacteria bacterium]
MITFARNSAKSSAAPAFIAAKSYSNLIFNLISLTSGAVLALSAPGFDQWYLAWVGLAPLILLCASSNNKKQSFVRGLLFGLGYHLVYLNWVFGLHPMDWLKFSHWQSCLVAAVALAGWSFHQALLVAVFAVLCRLIPLTGSVRPQKINNRWHWPALLVIPTIWVLWMSKIGNAHCLLGVPWGMLEYSQYKQLFVIQIASTIGGIGVGFLIAAFNTALACLVATLAGRDSLKEISARSRAPAVFQLVSLSLIIISAFALSFSSVKHTGWPANQTVSILQGNINFCMFRGLNKTAKTAQTPFLSMISHCPPGLCIGPENALAPDGSADRKTTNFLSGAARKQKLDVVYSCVHTEFKSVEEIRLTRTRIGYRQCNSAFAISSTGEPLSKIYKKRFLVPISEYTPQFFQSLKEMMCLPSQWQGISLSSGKEPVVFDLPCGSVAPLICVECLSPELAASSVRAGGQLLVTLGDPSFLHDSMVGSQMIALNVLRAVENRRYVIFACNTGPSAIIDPQGNIVLQGSHGKEQLLVGKVGFSSEVTPFCRWFSSLGRL